MANAEQLEQLEAGVKNWNRWVDNERGRIDCAFEIDLRGADLRGVDLRWVDLNWAQLSEANLSEANLSGARLVEANLSKATLVGANLPIAQLSGANLSEANLSEVRLSRANLIEANLRMADLSEANLSEANLSVATLNGTNLARADFTKATLGWTVLVGLDLSEVIGLDTVRHLGQSSLGMDTLLYSEGSLPESFLRGVGLPDHVIAYIPSLANQPIQYYTCFISYSTKDQEFADRLYADLQARGVRCWFAPEDMPIGGKILDTIDQAIRLREKLLLILSEHSVASDWVEDEVKTAFEEERRRKQTVLFPVRLDDAVMATTEAWAAKLRADRNIGDFRGWRDHNTYQQTITRVLKNLRPTA